MSSADLLVGKRWHSHRKGRPRSVSSAGLLAGPKSEAENIYVCWTVSSAGLLVAGVALP